MCRSLIFFEGVLFGHLRRQIACSILGPEAMGSASLALDDMAFWLALLRGLQLCVGCLTLELRPCLASGVFMGRPWGSEAL
jgi:hypothetical protein